MSGYSYGRLGSTVGAGTPETSSRYVGEDSITFSVTPAVNFDAGDADNKRIVLTGNVSSSTFVCTRTGNFCLRIIQDEVGGHSFEFPTNIAGSPPAPDITPGSSSVYRFYYDGTDFHF